MICLYMHSNIYSDHMGQVLKVRFYRVLVVLHLVLLESKGNFHTFWMQLSWLQCALLIYSQACHQKNQLGPNQTPFWLNKNQIANKNIKRELVVLAWVRSQKMNEINPAAIVLKSQSHIFRCQLMSFDCLHYPWLWSHLGIWHIKNSTLDFSPP